MAVKQQTNSLLTMSCNFCACTSKVKNIEELVMYLISRKYSKLQRSRSNILPNDRSAEISIGFELLLFYVSERTKGILAFIIWWQLTSTEGLTKERKNKNKAMQKDSKQTQLLIKSTPENSVNDTEICMDINSAWKNFGKHNYKWINSPHEDPSIHAKLKIRPRSQAIVFPKSNKL